MPELTVCIPCAPYHDTLVQRAVESVMAQTVECGVLVYKDTEVRGAGYSRNQLLAAVKTPMVAFLDADDTIEPQFADSCLQVWGAVGGSRYVYTNWYGANRMHRAAAPCDMWKTVRVMQIPPTEDAADFTQEGSEFVRRTWHPVTTMMPTSYARRIGGFDEKMSALEDVDFYRRLMISGVCGIHLNEPLFHYHAGGQRSVTARILQDGVLPEQQMIAYMVERYGDYTMGCCGDPAPGQSKPDGERYDGDVMAMALWAGNRRERGRVTGRIYPYCSKPLVVYVDPRDVAARPDLWQKVSAMPSNTPPVLQPGYAPDAPSWRAVGNLVFGGGIAQQTPQPAPQSQDAPVSQDWQYNPVQNTRNTSDILKIAQRKTAE